MNVDDLMAPYEGDVPGASVLVVRDGRVILRKSWGMADLEEHVATTPDTHVRLASVTKQFTAAAILILAHEGRLSLDDPITRWLPSMPQYASGITIRNLLTHTSGLLAYEDLIPPGTTRQVHDIDVLHLLEKTTTTNFPPGLHYRYSNTGYSLLSLIVERASGQPFAQFLHDRIFAPAGMQTSVAFEEGISTVPHRAYGYSRTDAGWRRTDQSLTSAVLGDGGIYTSIDDLVHWIAVLESGRFDEALVPRTPTDDPAIQYGYGWRITEHRGRRVVAHSGETIGFRNAIVRFPDQHLTVVVLTNRDEGDPNAIALQIADRADS